MGLFSAFFEKLKKAFKRTELDADFYDDLEQLLISADIGVATSLDIIEELKNYSKKDKVKDIETAQKFLKDILIGKLEHAEKIVFDYPLALTIIGVNGVGKTTSIAKMANFFNKNKKSVLLAAGDTFRAGAIEQLDNWANRIGTKIIKQEPGSDSASVVYDAIKSAKAKKYNVLLIDTAGRLHTNVNLMHEIQKIDKIINREYEEAQKLNLIVLDASIGQNSLQQVKVFSESMKIDGIIVTKLDGTAKGGVVFQIINELNIPILFTCFGETVNDIATFDAKNYIEKILM